GLGQGHNQKKDTHTLDFDVTLFLGLKQWTSLIFHFAKICLEFPFGQQPVNFCPITFEVPENYWKKFFGTTTIPRGVKVKRFLSSFGL
ncbi:unnamed protein product, partial [marine sediment metagenome]